MSKTQKCENCKEIEQDYQDLAEDWQAIQQKYTRLASSHQSCFPEKALLFFLLVVMPLVATQMGKVFTIFWLSFGGGIIVLGVLFIAGVLLWSETSTWRHWLSDRFRKD